ncbi:hypothetical protein ACHWQZ_G008252 [Mnemiopsis leidyi]
MLNRPTVSSNEQSGSLAAFRSSRPDQCALLLDSSVEPPAVASRISRPLMGALKRSISLDLTDYRASHNSSDSGYTSDYCVPSPENFTADVGITNRSLSFSLSNSSNKSDSVFYRSPLEQCSKKSSISESDKTRLADNSALTTSPTSDLNAKTDVLCKPISRNIIKNAPTLFNTLLEETTPPSPDDLLKSRCLSEKPRSVRVSAEHSKDISKIAKKFESCSRRDKLEFVSYYVATNEQRVLKRFIAETPEKEKDVVVPVPSHKKMFVTYAGEVQVFSVPRTVTTPKLLVRSFSVDCLECRIYPKLKIFSAEICFAYFSPPSYITPNSKQTLRDPIELPTYDLGLKPYKRKLLREPGTIALENVHENKEISPVPSNSASDPGPTHCIKSELERPSSILLDSTSSLDSVSIENFLIQSSVTSSDRIERTLQLGDWARWRRDSIDLPTVPNPRRSNFISSRYLGRAIPRSHEKRPCKLFLSKTDLSDDDESPPTETVAHTQPAIPSYNSRSVSLASQKSSKKGKKKRRETVDLTYVGFNAFSHFKHLVNTK